MEQAISLSAAKAHLAGLVQAAETVEVVHISRHGKPVAMLMSEQAYAALQGQQAGYKVDVSQSTWSKGAFCAASASRSAAASPNCHPYS